MDSLRFHNQVILITGGSSGIGLATAKAFAQQGASVIITGRNQTTLDAARQAIGALTLAVQADMSQLTDIELLMQQIHDRFGRLDVLFANAGISKFFPLEQTSEAVFDAQVAVNFKGVFFTVQQAIPLMMAGGSIILNASIGTQMGVLNASVYNATKAAVRSLGRTFAAELARFQIRVNVVSPGTIATDILNRAEGFDPANTDTVLAHYATQIALKRIGQPQEIAQAVLFLASSDSSYINGVELVVDGGLLEL